MAKQAKNDRQAVIDSIRKQQKGAEKRQGMMIVAVAGLIAVGLIGAVAWKPISDAVDRRKFQATALADIGSDAEVCGEVTKKDAEGEQDHVDEGTPMTYPDSPPAFGKHWGIWDTMERQFYSEGDRPELGELVHNLEHGFTLVWYDETAAKDSEMMDDLRGLAAKFDDETDYRNKAKIVPWTSKDGDAFPKGQHIAFTHWSAGRGLEASGKQEGVWQYCSAPSGAALEKFMLDYPYMDSPEPDSV
ncbi:MAG: DUF3105 domain-containing protein [Nocardioides sp.]|uniref:DUF3105 domain-containing protein n=1 Tax=Nocardioides sp. TaxID=35761 RepID=UPI003EFC3C46